MNDYEARRAANIARNRALLSTLDLPAAASRAHPLTTTTNTTTGAPRPAASARPTKRARKRSPSAPTNQPTRTSARLAAGPPTTRPVYTSPPPSPRARLRRKTPSGARALPKNKRYPTPPPATTSPPPASTAELMARWSAWTPSAPAPTRDAPGAASRLRFHFADAPAFTPNASPAEMLRQGVFGGSYFRPYRSRALGGATVRDDWRELPAAWLAGLDVPRRVAGAAYDAAANRYGVACGQSIEEWEAAGWIDVRWDVRGWFQWYARFFQGRRCEDDERQIGRWRRCVGETGRWRRLLLKKYVRDGVREVWDGTEGEGEVSPVNHQTCLHWAYQITQRDLDTYWQTGA